VHHDVQQRGVGEGVVLPPQRRRRSSIVHWEGAEREARCLGVRCVTPSRQRRLEPLTNALRQLADSGLALASVIANFHHRRVIPLWRESFAFTR
jgi:hypothetical protein